MLQLHGTSVSEGDETVALKKLYWVAVAQLAERLPSTLKPLS